MSYQYLYDVWELADTNTRQLDIGHAYCTQHEQESAPSRQRLSLSKGASTDTTMSLHRLQLISLLVDLHQHQLPFGACDAGWVLSTAAKPPRNILHSAHLARALRRIPTVRLLLASALPSLRRGEARRLCRPL